MDLKLYNEKRDFNITSEPKGIVKNIDDGKRVFVIQKHAASSLHYDLRLEYKGVLLSWAVPKGPSTNPKDKRLAVETEPHPYAYKDFEGIIPKDEYGGGTMIIWDEGFWIPEGDINLEEAFKSGRIKIIMQGERLKGTFSLVRMKPRGKEKAKNWLFIKDKDEYASEESIVEKFDTSVRSNLNLEQMRTLKTGEEAQ